MILGIICGRLSRGGLPGAGSSSFKIASSWPSSTSSVRRVQTELTRKRMMAVAQIAKSTTPRRMLAEWRRAVRGSKPTKTLETKEEEERSSRLQLAVLCLSQSPGWRAPVLPCVWETGESRGRAAGGDWTSRKGSAAVGCIRQVWSACSGKAVKGHQVYNSVVRQQVYTCICESRDAYGSIINVMLPPAEDSR